MDATHTGLVSSRTRAHKFTATTLGALVAVCQLVLAAPAAAQSAFQPGVEGQIWHQLPPVGTPVCTIDPATSLCTDTPTFDLGKYYYPVSIVSDVLPAHTTPCVSDSGTIVNYVTDQFNHRVQAFDYCGSPVPFTHAPGGLPTIGGGPVPAGPMMPGAGATGLNFPQGITVDSGHNIIVADLGNSRVVVFHQDGSYLALPTPTTDIRLPAGSLPTGVATFPGTVMGTSGALAVLLSRPPLSALLIYDAQGHLIAQNPQPESCDLPAAVGGLCGPTDLTIDPAGIIYVADYQNARINAYTADLIAKTVTYRFTFGTPVDQTNPTPSDLSYPYALRSVMVGSQQRLMVSDQANQRIAVYAIAFPGPLSSPTITYLFYLDARGDLNGFPTGISVDGQGRLYALDTGNQRIQRFEVPDLALVNLQTSPPDFVSGGGVTYSVTAGVAVPLQKTTVSNVSATSNAVNSGTTFTIPAGELANFTWNYTSGALGSATYNIAASGNAGLTTANPPKAVSILVGCPVGPGCEMAAPVTTPSFFDSGPTFGIWHAAPVNVQLDAVDVGDSSAPASGVKVIRVYLTGAHGGAPLGPPCAVQLDQLHIEYRLATPAQVLNLNANARTVVWFRAEDNNGNLEPLKSLPLNIDSLAPLVVFYPAPPPNDAGWYNISTPSVAVTYRVIDNGSGVLSPSPPTGVFNVSAEGVSSPELTHVCDNLNNCGDAGYTVLIDRTRPIVSAPSTIVAEFTSPAGTPVTVPVTASDPLGAGVASGVASIRGPQSGLYQLPAGFKSKSYVVSFQAVDVAGNVSIPQIFTTITIQDTVPPVFTRVPPSGPLTPPATTVPDFVGTGQVLATDLNVPVTITQSPAAGTLLLSGASVLVTFTAKDAAGNVSTTTTTISVSGGPDTTVPAIVCAPPTTIYANSATGYAVVPVLATATDNSGFVTLGQTPAASSQIHGRDAAYTVYAKATDATGNYAYCTTTLLVRYSPLPTITCSAALTIQGNGAGLATVPVLAKVGGSTSGVTLTQTPAASTQVGANTVPYPVTATATNAFGSVSCTTTLTVKFPPPPRAYLIVYPNKLWPPDHKLMNVYAYLLFAGSTNGVKVELISITSSEPDSGLGDGDQPNDVQTANGQPIGSIYGTDIRTFKLRAERSGTGPGRFYTVTYKISNAGGSITRSARVLVPHDQSAHGHFNGDGCPGNRHWDSDLDGHDGDDRREDFR